MGKSGKLEDIGAFFKARFMGDYALPIDLSLDLANRLRMEFWQVMEHIAIHLEDKWQERDTNTR